MNSLSGLNDKIKPTNSLAVHVICAPHTHAHTYTRDGAHAILYTNHE